MPLLRLVLMVLLAFAADVSTPLLPEAFGLEDAEEAAPRAPRRPRVASIRETSGPAVAQRVTVRRVVVHRREAAARPEPRAGVAVRKVPSPAPEPSSPEAH